MPATYQSSDVTGYTLDNGTTTYEADNVVTSADSGLRVDLQLSPPPAPDGANNAVTIQAFGPAGDGSLGPALSSPIPAGSTNSSGFFTDNIANVFGDYFTTLPFGTYTVRITASAPDGSSTSVDQTVQYEAPGSGAGGGSPPPATVALTTINGTSVTGNDEFAYNQVGSDLVLSGTTTNSGGTVALEILQPNGSPLPHAFLTTDVDGNGNFSFDIPAATIAADEGGTAVQPGQYAILANTYDLDGNATDPFVEQLTVGQPSDGSGGSTYTASLDPVPTIDDSALQNGVTISGSTNAPDGSSVFGYFQDPNGDQYGVLLGNVSNGRFSQLVPGDALQAAIADGRLPNGTDQIFAQVNAPSGPVDSTLEDVSVNYGQGGGSTPTVSLDPLPTLDASAFQNGITVSGSTNAPDGSNVYLDVEDFALGDTIAYESLGTVQNGQFSQFLPGDHLQSDVSGVSPSDPVFAFAEVSTGNQYFDSANQPLTIQIPQTHFVGVVDNLTPGSSADLDINGPISQLLPGDQINFQVFTDAPVNVSNNTATLQLNNGEQATFAGVDSSGGLDFSYTVQSGTPSTDDLQVTGINTDGAYIADPYGNYLSSAPLNFDTGFTVNADAPTVAFTQGLVASGGATDPDRASIFTLSGTVSNLTPGPGSHVEIFSYDPNQNGGEINNLGSAKLKGDGTWTMKNVDVGANASTSFFAEAVNANAAGDLVSFSEITADPYGIKDKNDPNLPGRTVNVQTGDASDTGANFVYTSGSGQETFDHFDINNDTLHLPKAAESQIASFNLLNPFNISTHGSNIPGGFEFNTLTDGKGNAIGPVDLLGPDVNKQKVQAALASSIYDGVFGGNHTFQFG